MKKDILVCRCKKVATGDIMKAVANGADTFEKVQEETKVATGCGACTKKAKEVFEEILSQQ